MIRTSWITWRRTNARVGFFDQFFIAEVLVFYITPELLTYTLVQQLGKGLGQAVGQYLQRDLIIVVVGVDKFFDVGIDALDGNGKGADEIICFFAGFDIIGQREVG